MKHNRKTMKTKTIIVTLALSSLITRVTAQETQTPNDSMKMSINSLKKDIDILRKLKISGYIQAQYQLADSIGQNSFDGGSFAPNSDSRFMIRRGRVKFAYSNNLADYVIQVNITDKGMNPTEVSAKITEPWTKWFGVKIGLFNRPFSFEVQQSSSVRETPERARYLQTLLSNERDIGAALVIEAPKNSKLHGLSFTGGFFNGTGIPSNGDYNNPNKPFYNDFDSFKDFIGRLSYNKSLKNDRVKFGLGLSHYNGKVRQYNNIVYSEISHTDNGTMTWVASDTTQQQLTGKGAGRIFYGADAQLSVKSPMGTTTLRGDFMCGQQPGTSSSSSSQAFEVKSSTYIRNFTGYSAVFVHRIGKSKHELAAKYAFYDPNTAVAGDQIGVAGSRLNATDISFTEVGFGYTNYFNDNFKFMIYYNIVKNETSKNLAAYNNDLKDNVLTLRVQVKF
ncbi:hypothetical protein [Aurantibacillus circumpalustris]|uniref:hypothetical protein n=1 Tax=Aurantibacillus circumpalustris TaxID=3036359 RepID=UPI00295A71B5|nr:hypothetical protein [Aurantibacillus circumpalustris]